MKIFWRSTTETALAVLLALAPVGIPALAQDETDGEDDGRFGRVVAEVGTWVAQASGLDYYPAIEATDNLFETKVLSPTYGTANEFRYRFGYELSKNRGKLLLTWYSHSEDLALARDSRSRFVFGETLAHPAYAGYLNDGLADAFDSEFHTRLRDFRLGFYRTAFDSPRVKADWFVGWRRVRHVRLQGALYSALVPALPGFIPQPDEEFLLDPLPDFAEVESDYAGRGLEAGMDFLVPIWKDQLLVEAGFALAALRGKTDASYQSTTHFYTLVDEILLPSEYDDAFSDPDTVSDIRQEDFQIGLQADSLSSSSDVQELYLGLRWKTWRELEVFAGFRSARYSDVGVEIRPQQVTSVANLNFQDLGQIDRSATYEGFYAGLAYSF